MDPKEPFFGPSPNSDATIDRSSMMDSTSGSIEIKREQYALQHPESQNMWYIVRLITFLWVAIESQQHCFAESSLQAGSSHFVSETKSVFHQIGSGLHHGKEVGLIRYHYDAVIASCQYVVLLGVGTFMSVTDYEKISLNIVADQPIVVVITDHNVDNFEKTSTTKYATLVNEITYQLQELIPICRLDDGSRILFGGHSASGQAAMQAWQTDLIDKSLVNPLGFVGLDPYEISTKTMDESMVFDLASLYWGFTRTTCLVSVDKAAQAGYDITNKSERVIYTIHNDENERDITHCVFTDHGCGFRPFICGGDQNFDWVHDNVAKSTHLFIQSLTNVIPFTRDSFILPQSFDEVIDVWVNEDIPNKNRTVSLRTGQRKPHVLTTA